MVPERANHCPPQERAASTTANEEGFVEASLSRVLRDGEGSSIFKLSNDQKSGRRDFDKRWKNCKISDAWRDL